MLYLGEHRHATALGERPPLYLLYLRETYSYGSYQAQVVNEFAGAEEVELKIGLLHLQSHLHASVFFLKKQKRMSLRVRRT